MLSYKILFKEILNLFTKYPYLILLIPLFLIAYPLLLAPGISIGNGDLPYLETSLYGLKKLWTWVEFGSYHNMEYLPRLPTNGLWLGLQFLNVPSDLLSKLLIISGFLIASFSFYFSCLLFFKSKIDIQNFKFKVAAILGSLFYAYNVWSFHRIGHWYFWIGYGLLPIFFISVIYALQNPKKLHYPLACVALWSVASATPHMVIFYGLIFVILSIIFLIKNIGKSNAVAKLLGPIFLIIAVYPLINLYWIYPYLASSTSETFLWNTVVTEETTKELSREANFPNVLRLLEGTFNMGTIHVVPPENSTIYPVWLFAGFVPPIVAFSSLLFGKGLMRRSILFFSLLAVVGILFTIGTNGPFNIYSILLFGIPFVSYLQVLFREPDKWGFLIGFGYAFLLTIASMHILNKFETIRFHKEISIVFVVFIFVSITIYFYPAYSDSLKNLYSPVVLPEDFGYLAGNISSIKTGGKVFFMPYSAENTIWGGDKGTLNIYPIFSPKSNIAPSDYNTLERYHNFLVDSIIKNKTNSISNALYPLGSSLLVYHNDTLMPNNNALLTKLGQLGGLRDINDIGFFKIFKVGKAKLDQLHIPKYNILVVGGLNQFNALNYLPDFDSYNASLVFLDQRIKNEKDKDVINNSQYLLASKNANEFIFSLIKDSQVVSPFDATIHHDPEKLWSKASVNDPGNAWFNPYLSKLGMDNSDFDYGKGLAITSAIGANLSIPIDIADNDEYSISVRYLKNQKGGMMNVYLDGKQINELFTKSRNPGPATFVWNTKDSSVNLSKGSHILTLENAYGFNAVNIFTVMPSQDWIKLTESGYSLANNLENIIHILEAESNFVNVKGINNVAHTLFSGDTSNGTFLKTYSGQFVTPEKANLLSLQLLAKGHPNSNSSYSIKNVEIRSAEKNDFFIYDFENVSTQNISNKEFININQKIFIHDFENVSTQNISDKDWMNDNSKLLSLSSTSNLLTGNSSLRVNVGQGNTTNWSILSTDFIPVKEDAYYNYSLNIAASNVNQLHSKVIYYDSNKKEMGWDFVFGGIDGTFKDNITNTLHAPHNADQIKLQIWIRPNQSATSYYLVNDTLISPTALKQVWINDNKDVQNISFSKNGLTGNSSLKVNVGQGNTTNWSILSTDFIPVKEDAYYNYSLNIAASNVNQLHSKVIYYDSNKKEIGWDFVLGGRDGTFNNNVRNSFLPVLGTKYLKLQILVHPNLASSEASTYWVDNVKVSSYLPPASRIILKDDFASFKNANTSNERLKIIDDTYPAYLRTELLKSNPQHQSAIETIPLPVKENGIYNYTMTVESDNLSSLIALASFRNSDDVVVNLTKYGTNAGNGGILALHPGSEISTQLDMLRSSNYTIALRTNNCTTCTPLMMTFEDKHNNIINTFNITTNSDTDASNSISPQLNWYSNNIYLNKGNYALKINSDSERDIDSILVYSNSNYTLLDNGNIRHKGLQDILGTNVQSTSAYVSGYEQINPTKYELTVKNATKPYLLSFSESYDPLWNVYSNDFSTNDEPQLRTNSIPLYSTINGFYINKTGNYTLHIEYEPQKWFLVGGIVSIITSIFWMSFILARHFKKHYFISKTY